MLELLTAGVIVVGADGRLDYANPGAARILHSTPERLIGRAAAEVFVSLQRMVDAAGGAEAQREVTVTLDDGTSTVVGFSVSAPSLRGARAILFQEITAVLELRRERDRLLQMAALGDALPSILHELRNPLAAVTSMLEVLVEEADDPLREQLHSILWEVRRMSLTLQGVGGLARPMHSDRYAAVDLAVCEACRILEGTAQRRGVTLTAEVPTLPLVPLDRGVVSGVVFNLVKNAIEACEEGDAIVVSAALEPDDTFILRVADSGQGMTPAVLDQCRQLFFTSKQQGSGIGLALCQQIAESSGGSLDIASTAGVGTVVTLAVPLHPARRVPVTAPNETQPSERER